MAHATLQLTTGLPRTGKSYRRGPHWILNEWLQHYDGTVWTTIPIYRDKLAQAAAERAGLKDWRVYLDRIQIIPHDEVERWKTGESSPAKYFKGIDLRGCHVQIDEAFKIWPKKSRGTRSEEVAAWLAEIGHLGCTIEFLCQSRKQLHSAIEDLCQSWVLIETNEEDKDPLLRVRLGDWMQLIAKFTRKYRPWCREIRRVQRDEKWVNLGEPTFFVRNPFYYDLYDSYSKPSEGGVKATAPLLEYQRFSTLKFFLWFLNKNITRFVFRGLIIAFVVWLIFFGGVGKVVKGVTGTLMASAQKQASSISAGEGMDDEQYASWVEMADRAVAAEAERDELLERLAKFAAAAMVAAEHKKLEAIKRRVVLFRPGGVVLDDGQRLSVGGFCVLGDDQYLVMEINHENRCVYLSGDICIDADGLRFNVPGGQAAKVRRSVSVTAPEPTTQR